MAVYVYPSAEWLEESARLYGSEFENKLRKLTGFYTYRIKAAPAWGLDKDILMCSIVESGKLVRLAHCTEEDAKENADFIMAAEANTWKRILRKLDKFVGAFMGQRIKLEKGNTVKALGLAPHANTLVDSLTQVELKFPDELSPDELEAFKVSFAAYREKAGV